MLPKIQVEKIEHTALIVTDITRAKHFYGQILNLTEVPRPQSFNFIGAWYRNGPTDLHLISAQEADAQSRRHVAFLVEDLTQAAQILEQNHYPVKWETMKIPGLSRFFTQDPDGNRIEIMARDGD